MKIIITGATGLIGRSTLEKALNHPEITKVVAYTRKPLQQQHTKLENVISKDLDLPEDPSPCIWCAGAKLGVSMEECEQLEEAALVAASRHGRFVYLSGMLAVKNQDEQLWFASEGRKLKGRTEAKLTNEESYIARPSMVIQNWTLPMTVRVDDLASVLVHLAVNGDSRKTWENSQIVGLAKELKQ
ncbi:MAG: hypothetical protein GOMPHAMPRED_000951 [Gomphillus americanus]|uniref:Uncharacterized protein n=1 Tax=Gomphillus americanus TaxID=1940652 RepID=A0A8H3IJV3_9LECA|nr:MAG: hypothetical protein GOMPHAMPRED_000951 [Gomphillus americanus]